MKKIQTDVLVIGGGATGTGVVRDLAMRGFHCVLIERRDLAYGTTGRYHGLLHSGGRYVVKDPQAARECYEENLVLRHIMPQCIEDTGGFFVSAPSDPLDYIPKFLDGCRQAGIPAEEVSVEHMLKVEPLLNPGITHCISVPDATADSFLAARLNAESARTYGAQILTYHEFRQLLVKRGDSSDKQLVVGAVCQDLIKDEEVHIEASVVVNASGAWAGKILESTGINLEMVPGKGTMLAVNHRIVNTVINRCKLPSDGDILVPTHTVAVIGTTDIKVADPDHYAIEPWEIRLMLDEGEKIIPGFKQLRILRAWAGVRPLVKSVDSSNNRDISRGFVLIDHSRRDGVEGILTITSGKWTTYRKMAQVIVDAVCQKLNVDRECRTHIEALPNQKGSSSSFYQLGHRLDKVEQDVSYGKLVCECELVTDEEVKQAIVSSNSATLDDIRRATRLGMGPCQGAFCSFRAAGILQSLRQLSSEEANSELIDFLEERWKGDLSILSGKQLQQARFNELIYINVLNTPNLPGERSKKLSPVPYVNPEPTVSNNSRFSPQAHFDQPEDHLDLPSQKDVIVIGGGFAGLFTAWQLAKLGKSVKVLTKGWGSPYWLSGCIDIVGYEPPDYHSQVANPHDFLEKFTSSHPTHPYSLSGMSALEQALDTFLNLCTESGYPFQGTLAENVPIPTAIGTLRPSCLIPSTMSAGNATLKTPMVIVGFDGYLDFFPGVVSENLNTQGIIASSLSLELLSLSERKFLSSMVLARLFDTEEFCQEVIDALKPRLGNTSRIGFPAVLGITNPMKVMDRLQSALGIPVFEIPGLPASVPGIRLHNLLVAAIERFHGMIYNGTSVVGASQTENQVQAVWSEAASRFKQHAAKDYVLATGGILGGGSIGENGYTQETIFNLSITPPKLDAPYLHQHFLDHAGHPIYSLGVETDGDLHPCDPISGARYQNLYVVGNSLAHCDPLRERSIEGIALATGYRVAEIIVGENNR